MLLSMRYFSIITTLLISLILTGCYNKSIRHLGSDAALIKVNSSTKTELLTYLGEPDEQNVLSESKEEWIYSEEKVTIFQRLPFIGPFFSGNGYDKIFVILENDIVRYCQYFELASDEFDWSKDFSWQEKVE